MTSPLGPQCIVIEAKQRAGDRQRSQDFTVELKALNEELMAPLITIKEALCRGSIARKHTVEECREVDCEISAMVALTSSTQRGAFRNRSSDATRSRVQAARPRAAGIEPGTYWLCAVSRAR